MPHKMYQLQLINHHLLLNTGIQCAQNNFSLSVLLCKNCWTKSFSERAVCTDHVTYDITWATEPGLLAGTFCTQLNGRIQQILCFREIALSDFSQLLIWKPGLGRMFLLHLNYMHLTTGLNFIELLKYKKVAKPNKFTLTRIRLPAKIPWPMHILWLVSCFAFA